MLHEPKKENPASRSLESPDSNHLSPLSQAWHLRNSAKWGEAFELCRHVLSQTPENGEAWHLLGILYQDRGNHQEAAAHLDRAITVDPDQPMHYNNLGVVLNDLKRHREAAIHFQKALALSSDYLDAKCNLGLALFHDNHMCQAVDIFNQVLLRHPGNGPAHANLGLVRLAQHHYCDAVSEYQKAISADDTKSQWHGNLGAAHAGLGDYEKAANSIRNALALSPGDLGLNLNLGIAFSAMGRHISAINAFKTALAIKPGHPEAICHLIIALEQTCHWTQLEPLYAILDRNTRQALIDGELPSEDPMLNIRRCDDLALNRAVAQAWSQNVQCEALRLASPFKHDGNRQPDGRITLGYLSYDFRDHPVAHQLFPLFGTHDRERFKVVAFSLAPDDGSPHRKEIQTHSDAFFDIGSLGLVEASQTIQDQHVDILIDLMGHSKHNRMGLLALRPAPIQISYLGFLSTTGADFIDYLVVDDIVVPPEHHGFMSERCLCLPGCYQMNHAVEMDGTTDTRRKDWNLPTQGFVFCCFNVAYKIDRRLFDTWMRILKRTPDSVLWLFASNPTAVANMRARAEAHGIHADRLVFAEKMPLPEHLRRLSLADLALDTLRYNGGATTANALAAGLPVLTVMGKHWVSRMSASHLTAAGLPEMVVSDLGAYEQKAVELALHPNRLDAIRNSLRENRKTHALFDHKCFVGALETGFKDIWKRHISGKSPRSIRVSANVRQNNAEPKKSIRYNQRDEI